MIISDRGKTFYVIPRQFVDSELPFNTCWNDIAGLITFKEKFSYNDLKEEDIKSLLTSKVSLSQNMFNDITEKIQTNFENLYIIQKS